MQNVCWSIVSNCYPRDVIKTLKTVKYVLSLKSRIISHRSKVLAARIYTSIGLNSKKEPLNQALQ